MKLTRNNQGFSLVVAIGVILILSAVATYFIRASLSHRITAQAQQDLAKALYVAEAGLQRGVAYVAQGGTVPATFSGSIGDGVYAVTIVRGATLYESQDTLAGAVRCEIRVNPGGGGNSFAVTLADGGSITIDDLRDDYPGYHGQATLVRFMPIGGQHNALMVNDEPYPVSLGKTYEVSSDLMTINIYNDKVRHNKAMGRWWVAIAAAHAEVAILD